MPLGVAIANDAIAIPFARAIVTRLLKPPKQSGPLLDSPSFVIEQPQLWVNALDMRGRLEGTISPDNLIFLSVAIGFAEIPRRAVPHGQRIASKPRVNYDLGILFLNIVLGLLGSMPASPHVRSPINRVTVLLPRYLILRLLASSASAEIVPNTLGVDLAERSTRITPLLIMGPLALLPI